MVTGAEEGPREGESKTSMDLMRSEEKRAKKASSAWLRVLPARTCLSKRRAAGRHLAHLRDSFTHWATLTGSLGHGAKSSETHVDHSFFSRGVSELVSTPDSVTSWSALPGACPAPAELLQVLW